MEDISDERGRILEVDYVRETYDQIAEDFSSTRYKKWPKVDEFLRGRPASSLLLDIGCGNGKYLDTPGTVNIGCDISLNLLKICKSRGFEVVQCDMLRLPFRSQVFDSIICIAALHHVVSAKRREKCLANIVDSLAPVGSQCLIQVWSFEQELKPDNPYLKRHRDGGEVSPTREVTIAGDLKIPVHKNRTPFAKQDVLVPFHTKRQTNSKNNAESIAPTDGGQQPSRLRYYHLFKEGELDSLVQRLPGLELLQSYHDKGNWCVVVGRSHGTDPPREG